MRQHMLSSLRPVSYDGLTWLVRRRTSEYGVDGEPVCSDGETDHREREEQQLRDDRAERARLRTCSFLLARRNVGLEVARMALRTMALQVQCRICAGFLLAQHPHL